MDIGDCWLGPSGKKLGSCHADLVSTKELNKLSEPRSLFTSIRANCCFPLCLQRITTYFNRNSHEKPPRKLMLEEENRS